MTQADYSEWEQVSEEMLIKAVEIAEQLGSPGDMDCRNFKKVLLAGNKFKNAGLKPIYVYDELTNRLAVYAKELQGKKLH